MLQLKLQMHLFRRYLKKKDQTNPYYPYLKYSKHRKMEQKYCNIRKQKIGIRKEKNRKNRKMAKQTKQKQNYILHEKYSGGKIVSPQEMLCLLKKNENNRMWILKQLSQIGIDIHLLEDYSLSDLYRHCDQIIRSTYSIKYLGMNQNQMGIISRRIDPFKDSNFSLKSLPQSSYTVNKFFFPKPLKVGRKPKKQAELNVDNLESEIKKAFEKNNPGRTREKQKNRTQLSGSWLSSPKNKPRQKFNNTSQSYRPQPVQKILTQSGQGGIPNLKSTKKVVNSYSRFLSSGLIFESVPF